ncbi:MAG: cyclic nucleotide-binding domain-containing protein [Thermoleophilia bacterium]
MPDAEAAGFLATVPLFADRGQADLAELARLMRRRRLKEGEVLWHQGDEAREMAFIVDGAVTASVRVAGGRLLDVGTSGPGEMVGELALLDGGLRTVALRAAEATTVLALSRTDLTGLLSRRDPLSFGLRRRLMLLSAARLRGQLASLADPLPEGGPAPAADAELEYCTPPDSRYLRRMATFHDFDPLAVWGFLTSGRYARCPPGRTLVAEGAEASACFLTINGAVEKVMVRGGRRVRVGLAGPGRLFGYEGLIDGLPSPVTAIARERSLLLVLPREPFERLFAAEDGIARVFMDVIQRDIMVSMRQTLPALARRPGAPA